jgi:hypothetical protein
VSHTCLRSHAPRLINANVCLKRCPTALWQLAQQRAPCAARKQQIDSQFKRWPCSPARPSPMLYIVCIGLATLHLCRVCCPATLHLCRVCCLATLHLCRVWFIAGLTLSSHLPSAHHGTMGCLPAGSQPSKPVACAISISLAAGLTPATCRLRTTASWAWPAAEMQHR